MRARIAAVTFLASALAWAGPGQASFTPTAYRYPISRISLFKADSSGEQVLYQCAGATAAECLVDVTSPASVAIIEDAARALAIEPGTYAFLQMNSCPAGTSGSDTMKVQVKGSVIVGGQLFTTSSTADAGMALGGQPELTEITFGCGSARVQLLEPLVVTANSSQTLNLLVDLTKVTWTDANASPGMGGCKADGSTAQDVCTSMPFIVPYVGSAPPTFERYLVAHSATAGVMTVDDANASVNFAVDADRHVFYVSVAPYYSETSPGGGDPAHGGPDYNTSTRSFSANADESIAFQTGGSSIDNRVGFTGFERRSHAGVCKNEASTAAAWQYQAFMQ